MKITAEKRARKHWGFRVCAGRQTTFTVHIARYDFLCAGKIASVQKNRVCAHVRGRSGALLGTWMEGRCITLCRAGGGEVCCCARIGRMQQLRVHVREPHKQRS